MEKDGSTPPKREVAIMSQPRAFIVPDCSNSSSKKVLNPTGTICLKTQLWTLKDTKNASLFPCSIIIRALGLVIRKVCHLQASTEANKLKEGWLVDWKETTSEEFQATKAKGEIKEWYDLFDNNCQT